MKNFAVIESVTVPFASGLNVLTGETGAGKSILIDAILLVRGARAQTDVIRAEAETATVEAVFAIDGAGAAREVLDAAGLPPTTTARSSCGASWRARAGTAPSSTTRR